MGGATVGRQSQLKEGVVGLSKILTDKVGKRVM